MYDLQHTAPKHLALENILSASTYNYSLFIFHLLQKCINAQTKPFFWSCNDTVQNIFCCF
jgi:hypothetical protein